MNISLYGTITLDTALARIMQVISYSIKGWYAISDKIYTINHQKHDKICNVVLQI